MARWVWGGYWSVVLCAAVVLLIGCVADPLPSGDMGRDSRDSGRADAGDGRDGGDVDLAPEPEPDVEPVDMGMDGAGGERDIGVDEVVDEGVGGEMVDPPDHARVAVTRRGAETFFIWVDADGQLVTLEVDNAGRITAGPTVVAVPDARPERVVAREIGGHPWVAYGSEGRPVVLFQADLPGVTRVVLDELQGPPLLAQAGEGVLVVGRTADDELAWQRVTHDLQVEPRVVDSFGLGVPDDAAGVPAGAVLLFAGEGQCVQISDDDWQAAGTFVCPTGPARLLSDGQRVLVSRVYSFGNDDSIGVTSLYETTDDYQVAFSGLSPGRAFPNDGAQRTVVGGRVIDGTRRLVASVVGPYETWDSLEYWNDQMDWPFGRVRAMARRTLPSLARSGVCEGGGRCAVDDDCEAGVCAGAVGDQHLVALDFRRDGRPRILTLPLSRRSVGIPNYGIETDAQCIPIPEVCDGMDQDCDGDPDDGRCCRGDLGVDYRWMTAVEVARRGDEPDSPYDFVVGDVEPNDAYRMMYRLRGTQRWQGNSFSLRQLRGPAPAALGITINDAVDGRYLLAAGGVTGLVARQYVEGGAGDWALFMQHPTRQEDDFPPRAVAPIGCDEVLAADTLNHRSVGGENPSGEQFLVVCPDKIVRVYAVVGGENVDYGFEQFGIPEVEWATIHRSGLGQLEILVGFQVPDEGLYAVRLLSIAGGNAAGPMQLQGGLPSGLDAMGITDAVWPIHQHPVDGRPAIQIRDGIAARLAFKETEDSRFTWGDVRLAPNPDRVVFSPAGFHIYATGSVPPSGDAAEATGWWAADVIGNGGVYNLWSTEPVFTVDGPIAHWFVSKGSYGNDDRSISIGRYDLVVITPTDQTDRNWRFVTRETRCTAP